MSCIPTFSCAFATNGASTSAEVAAKAWRRVTRDFILDLPALDVQPPRARRRPSSQVYNSGWAGGEEVWRTREAVNYRALGGAKSLPHRRRVGRNKRSALRRPPPQRRNKAIAPYGLASRLTCGRGSDRAS